ncbi:MAG TPA: peptidylprolyl isomerase [Steroidobacteraceae bacterium]|nr:peptidylprolyl isomerase [Steroidobacteraceae bacterium]
MRHLLRSGLQGLPALLLLAAVAGAATNAVNPAPPPKPSVSFAEILKTSKPEEWRRPDPANTLYMDLGSGRVVIELAPQFTPLHAANIRTLAHGNYFDGLTIYRVQDNYVTQWGDADGKRPLPIASKLAPEYTLSPIGAINFTKLPDGDVYAPEAGFVDGFPAARDPATKTAWLVHCYGMVGAGRDLDDETGPGAELYAVNGSPTRHMDRNLALIGRVLQGMNLLSSLPRGTGDGLGMYEQVDERVPILEVRLAADLPEAERLKLEVMRTDSPSFRAIIEWRRNRHDDFYKVPAGHVDVCNIPVPVRTVP